MNISLLDFDKSSTTCTSRLKSETSTVSKTITEIAPKWIHEKLEFLKPEKIRDINKNKPSHPEYDKKTLYIPDDYFKTLTPAMKQWWELKCKHFDTVLFFKVGKFYELYHMDATVGVNHLGFSYMKVIYMMQYYFIYFYETFRENLHIQDFLKLLMDVWQPL